MDLTILPEEIQTEIIVRSDNPYIVIAEPSMIELVYSIMPHRLVQVLIEHDRVDLLNHITYRIEDYIHALRFGAIKFIKSHDLSSLTYDDMLFYSVESGDIDLVIYIVENLIPHHHQRHAINHAIDNATRHGHLEIVQYLVELGGEVSWDTIIAAGDTGNIDLLEYLIDQLGLEPNTNDPMKMVPSETIRQLIIHGHYDALKWLMDEGYFSDAEVRYDSDNLRYSFFDVAYGTGREDIIELMAEYDGDELEAPDEALNVAIETGNVAVIDRFYDKCGMFSVFDTDVLAKRGQLETLKALVAHGVDVDSSTLAAATKAGRDNIVEWFLSIKEFAPGEIIRALKAAITAERPKLFMLLQQYLEPADLMSVFDTLAGQGSVYLMQQMLQTIGGENVNLDELLKIAREENNSAVAEYLEQFKVALERGYV